MKKRTRTKIAREIPAIGSVLIGKFKGVPYRAKIVKDAGGHSGKAVEYAGAKYSSMTAAAKAITKQPTNGWRFWKIQETN